MGKARKLKSLRRGLLKTVAGGYITPEQADEVFRRAKGKPKFPMPHRADCGGEKSRIKLQNGAVIETRVCNCGAEAADMVEFK
jgi:hypothetical protein